MQFYAHTKTRPDGKPAPQSEWEPLFTPFGQSPEACHQESCEKCQRLVPNHGHLNKVAWWTAKFAEEMFAADSPDAKSAWPGTGATSQDFGMISVSSHLNGKPTSSQKQILTALKPATMLQRKKITLQLEPF